VAARRAALDVLVLAAGMGKRLRSKTIKLLHPVAGRPMVAHVLAAATELRPRQLITVVGHQADLVREALGESGTRFVLQREQRGTGHAVLQAARLIDPRATLLVLNGDLPTIRTSTLRGFVARHRRSGATLSVLSAEVPDPTGYGRVVRDGQGRIRAVVEQKDASAEERRIREINCGIYCARAEPLLRMLRRLTPNNAQGEYYLTDAVRGLLEQGERVAAVLHADAEELLGVNTRQELAQAGQTLHARKAEQLQEAGVTLVDASRTLIDPRAHVGADSVIYPNVIIEGPSSVGRECVIRQGTRLSNTTVDDRAEILDYCVIEDSHVGAGARVGPFARLRPGSTLEADTRVGNFVEIKKSRLGRGSKANHLSYLGDATIGPECNVGAGTITCNYDGSAKHATLLGRGVFVGSDTQLVAPVSIGDGAYVGAGTTVTKDVPPGALAISRAPQTNLEGWVARRARRAARGKA
jgi:bifunctional UDP-N-acetylglucosamine pyrophosphorylase / glucosamine-1-phosphate N-acetyltransferase